MAKPNLTSIFTSTNQYSVLKLLKALCDAVDNIDYADNTEFTSFKEQINSAINSLEQSVMNNENAISDLNTVTGNNSTEINSIKNKISGINTDSSGNVAVGKNLEVVGKIKLNNGFTPIHTYNEGIATHINVYSEIYYEGTYTFFGDIDGSIGVGYYELDSSNNISVIQFLSMGDNGILVYSGQDTWISYVTQYELADEMNRKQNKLYRHVITLRASSSSDGSCRLEYISSDSLQCRSLEGLRTLLGNPQMQSYVASNPSGDLFGVVISPSTAQIKKVGTTSLLNITSVSDTVTSL